MKSKRLLTLLLTLCMLVSVLTPAASALSAGSDTYAGEQSDSSFVTSEKSESSPTNSLVASGESVSNTLRTQSGYGVQVEGSQSSNWSIEATDAEPSVSLMDDNLADTLAELKEAEAYYSSSDKVIAFVVMEDAPLADRYTSVKKVNAREEAKLLSVQDAVISNIENNLLGGSQLEVRYQFTYLTNAFSIETEFGNLAKIAQLPNVKSVYLMPMYDPCTTQESTVSPNTVSAGAMTGVTTAWELDYTGQGMKIAVIDTGLDLDHPSFGALDAETAASSDSYLTVEDVAQALPELNAYSMNSSITAEKLYRSTKIPYAFNYVDENLTADHSKDSQGDHGTHVAGIAAANNVEGSNVVGMAPDAQIIVMKVFGASGGAYMDDIVAAMEDAMTLGCDVINASLGSAAGFSSSDSEQDLIFARLASQDIISNFSAGNDGTSSYDNMWGTDLNRTQNPDNAAVGSPSTYANNMSIASAENAIVMNNYFTTADGTQVFYTDPYVYVYAMTDLVEWGYGELEYVIIDGLGAAEDFYDAEGNSLVSEKVAVIRRGETSFGSKITNAEAAGAVAAIIWDNVEEDIFSFGMQITDDGETYPGIPACLIGLADGQMLADAQTKTLVVSAEVDGRVAEGGQMSSFSAWGVSPDLRIVPDITGIGGNVYSCYDGGTYGIMSGTSMSSPQVAGVSALVMQYLYTLYPNAPDGTLSELAKALLLSTAEPIISSESGIPVSPRQQGAGLVNAAGAVTAESYLTVGGERPKAELGDSTDGVYQFSFEIHNISSEAQTYSLSSVLMTEAYTTINGIDFMAGYDCALTGEVSLSKESVTVAAGGRANVTVTVTLSDEDKAMFAQHWVNGGYVEGYVYLTNEDGVNLSLPFLGFYGDWTQAPVFDTAYWYGDSFWETGDGSIEGDEYYNVVWTSLGSSEWVLGFNPYSGAYVDENGYVVYSETNNVISPNGDGLLDGISDLYLSLLRNAKTLTLTYTANGETLRQEVITNNGKTMYSSNYGQVVPWLYSWYSYEEMYDFTDAAGNVLPSGTTVLLTITAAVDYADGGEHSIQIPITVDTTKPQLLNVYELEQDGTYYLAAEVSDETALACVTLLNPNGTRIYAQEYDYTCQLTENGTYLVLFDVTGLGTELMVAVCDYAVNESYYIVSYTAAGDNLPEMDTSALYAYRVYDNYIYSDHMYGWVSLNRITEEDSYADISTWTDDYLEYAAINAAEYAGGKIFAVDAVNNFVVMEPGLWNRTTICNLGVNVLDMTFDDSTDTMYVLSKQEYYTYLYALDVMTGELTELKYYGYYSSGPWAIADDDNGTLYAVRGNSSKLYTIDVEGGTYAMTAVTDADGNTVVIKNSSGSAVSPSYYSQSITYSQGKLYWAMYQYSYFGDVTELIAIDTATWTSCAAPYRGTAYDTNDELVDYYPSTELVALLTLDETDWQIPEATEASAIKLSAEEMILGVGETQALTVSPLPWNYALGEIQWSSSNEAVVTVANGEVTGVGEGTAVVTATYGELSASCQITVVNIQGSFYAYNYYSADGNYGSIINVDLNTVSYTNVVQSPVDFLAGDYNARDGYFYGYNQGGQLYRYDINSGDIMAIGASIGTYPVDMAYDYSSNLMYVLMMDSYTYENTLYTVNMSNGKLLEMAKGYGLLTLACDTQGNLYGADAGGYVNLVMLTDYSEYGMGIMMEGMPLLDTVGDIFMLQSMCWDHNNDVLLWGCCESNTVYWIDVKAEAPYMVDLGDPTASGGFQFVGMFVVPESIPALAEVAAENVTADDMLLFAGYEQVPSVTVYPFNATCQTFAMTSSDTSVVEITASGNIKGVSAGIATVTATLTDTVGGGSYETTFNVEVINCSDQLYGHIMTDFASFNGQVWAKLDPGKPSVFELLESFDYTIYTDEYYNGKLYTYGYDANDWTANWNFFILDAETFTVETQIEMSDNFPFVYDMTYDYCTSTMYALAGANEYDTNLYVVDMTTGELVLLMETEQLFMSLAAGPDGVLYAMETSSSEFDWETWTEVYTNTQLYAIDPLTCELTWVGDTGVMSNMVESMTYDYDTEALYWTPFYNGSSYISSLCIVNTETGLATSLGTVGEAGAQVGGLYVICENYPEENKEALYSLLMTPAKASLVEGASATVSAVTMPMGVDAEIIWSSSNENVATVENGVITGISQGKATITASVTVGNVTKTAACAVAVLAEDAGFLTYNVTDGGWASISRGDTTVVTNLTEGEELGVITATAVGTDIYGYDTNGQLFKLDTQTYERSLIGQSALADPEEGYAYEIRDMAYDMANEQMLLLRATLMYDSYWDEYSEIYGGCILYSVDLETGELTELYVYEDVYVKAITADINGNVYSYNTFNDNISRLNLDSGASTGVVSLQSQSLYGDAYCTYALHYDELTGTIFMLFTGNGNFYRLLSVDTATGELNVVGYIGETVQDGWYLFGDLFAGLTFPYEHVHSYVVSATVAPTCTEDGSLTYTCPECDDSYTETVAATGHLHTEIRDAKEPTLSQEGYTGDTYCADCGQLLENGEVIPALGQVSGDCYFANYTDCTDEWYHEAVDFVAANGLMNGVSDTEFAPKLTLTRGMVVTVLYRQAGSPEVAQLSTFTDVAADAWYADAVAWAQSLGVVNGVSATEFAPEAEVTREQIATILWRYAGAVELEADLSAFADAGNISQYAETAMAWAVSEGIFQGSDGKLNPTDNATRAEFACIIMRYLGGSYTCGE